MYSLLLKEVRLLHVRSRCRYPSIAVLSRVSTRDVCYLRQSNILQGSGTRIPTSHLTSRRCRDTRILLSPTVRLTVQDPDPWPWILGFQSSFLDLTVELPVFKAASSQSVQDLLWRSRPSSISCIPPVSCTLILLGLTVFPNYPCR